jgi:hypothetical protein
MVVVGAVYRSLVQELGHEAEAETQMSLCVRNESSQEMGLC